MTLTQIEREAEKVSTNQKNIEKNKKKLRLNWFRDLVSSIILVVIAVYIVRNINRIDENTRIIAENFGMRYSVQTNEFIKTNIPCLNQFTENLIMEKMR